MFMEQTYLQSSTIQLNPMYPLFGEFDDSFFILRVKDLFGRFQIRKVFNKGNLIYICQTN